MVVESKAIFCSSVMACSLLVGCQRQDAVVPRQSRIVDTAPRSLFYSHVPPCSRGDHILKIEQVNTDFVWLFGAYNNGRHEENVLIEKTPGGARLRAFWHDQFGDFYTVDLEIEKSEFTSLITEISESDAFVLPNLDPPVSHGMTYWIKLKSGTEAHEACAYCVDIEEDVPLIFNREEQAMAANWKSVVGSILKTRGSDPSKLRHSDFDDNGNIKWDGKLVSEAGSTGSILD